MLPLLLLISRDAGISGDEELHYKQSEDVYDYFVSMGKDQDALNTPDTHLQYYGQAPDNFATILAHWFRIDDIYGFRHILSSFLGWLAIFVSALFARWLKGYGAAILTLVLFAVSPRFLGHLQNNLKDIPFALAYIAGVYYILKLTYINFKSETSSLILFLITSIAFSVGIRAGGILLVFYLFFAVFLYFLIKYFNKEILIWSQVKRTLLLIVIISFSGYLIGILFWPYALQNPISNPWRSFVLMTNFTTTIRQIFDGQFIWSDFHPWYYLPKYMLITIPIIVSLGLVMFVIFIKKIVEPKHFLTYGFLIFSILFPLIFVILKGSNLYGAWRHFNFLYPGIVILSAIGFYELFCRSKKIPVRLTVSLFFIVLMLHPLKFMASSHPYYYLYYNQLVGGLKGAYGKYETDYYYATLRSGAEWLQDYLEEEEIRGKVVVGSNFPVDWYFKDFANVECQYFTYHFRNDYDWDYAIIGNSYIEPNQLLNGNFPPEGTIHEVMVDDVPVCAVVARISKLPFEGAQALNDEYFEDAINLYSAALNYYQKDENVYFKLGKSLNLQGRNDNAMEAINHSLAINGTFEPSLYLAGKIKKENGDLQAAKKDFEALIQANKKYFIAYVELGQIYHQENNLDEARNVLKACLQISPRNQSAIIALGETYKETHPDIAEKYFELVESYKTLN